MPTSPQDHLATVEALKEFIAKFARAEVDTFVLPQLGEHLSFNPLRHTFDLVLQTVNRLGSLPLQQLPMPLISDSIEAFVPLDRQLQDLVNFSPDKLGAQNPIEVRRELIEAAEKAAELFFRRISPVVAYAAALEKPDMWAVSEQRMQAALQSAENSASEVEKQQKALEEIVRAAREVSGTIGSAQYASHFRDEASYHKNQALVWLIGTAVIAAATFTAAVWNYQYLTVSAPLTNPIQNVQVVVAKVILFSILFAAVFWCGRIYRTHRHNYVVNQHRQNALSSFEAFAQASDDVATKNAVLLQATQSIFAPQHTGYVSADADAGSSPQLIELIRTVTGPGK